jgi:hypothetical protein
MKYLYWPKSSKDIILGVPDSYRHPNHGEPMDLGDESEEENDENECIDIQTGVRGDFNRQKDVSFDTLREKILK